MKMNVLVMTDGRAQFNTLYPELPVNCYIGNNPERIMGMEGVIIILDGSYWNNPIYTSKVWDYQRYKNIVVKGERMYNENPSV